MPLLDVQIAYRELGRIRIGEKGAKGQPVKSETFILTSASRDLLEQAAALYGGQVAAWDDGPEQGLWRVKTTVDTLPIIIPPSLEPYSQWYEMWSGGGCQRRCDGLREMISDRVCLCRQEAGQPVGAELTRDDRKCKPTTRINVMLHQVGDLGVWRLETHGFYASREMPGTLNLLRSAAERGEFLEGRLRIEHRSRKVPGEGTRRYIVPVIDLGATRLAELTAGSGVQPAGIGAAPVGRPALPSGPEPDSAPMQRPTIDDDEPVFDEADLRWQELVRTATGLGVTPVATMLAVIADAGLEAPTKSRLQGVAGAELMDRAIEALERHADGVVVEEPA